MARRAGALVAVLGQAAACTGQAPAPAVEPRERIRDPAGGSRERRQRSARLRGARRRLPRRRHERNADDSRLDAEAPLHRARPRLGSGHRPRAVGLAPARGGSLHAHRRGALADGPEGGARVRDAPPRRGWPPARERDAGTGSNCAALVRGRRPGHARPRAAGTRVGAAAGRPGAFPRRPDHPVRERDPGRMDGHRPDRAATRRCSWAISPTTSAASSRSAGPPGSRRAPVGSRRRSTGAPKTSSAASTWRVSGRCATTSVRCRCSARCSGTATMRSPTSRRCSSAAGPNGETTWTRRSGTIARPLPGSRAVRSRTWRSVPCCSRRAGAPRRARCVRPAVADPSSDRREPWWWYHFEPSAVVDARYEALKKEALR